MKLEFSSADLAVIRQALLLRQAQLRRAINVETDSSILAIRQQQFKYIESLLNSFVSGV